MALIIGATPYTPWQELSTVLAPLGLSAKDDDIETWYRKSDIEKVVEGNAIYILLHIRPERALAAALEEGASIESALSEWCDSVQHMLTFQKDNRANTLLVDAFALAQEPAGLEQWLSGVGYKGGAAYQAEQVDLPRASPLMLMAGSFYAQQQEGVERLCSLLEAVSIPLNDEGYCAPVVDVSDALTDIKRRTEAQAKRSQDALKAEAESLEIQLHKVQEELEIEAKQREDAIQKISALEQKVDLLHGAFEEKELALSREIESQKREFEERRDERDTLKSENDLLLLQLHQTQEDLEDLFQNEKKLKAELIAVKKSQNDAQKELGTLELENKEAAVRYDEQAKRLQNTQELLEASAIKLEERDAHLRTKEDELKLVKNHLAKVQEDLKAYSAKSAQLEVSRSRTEKMLEEAQGSIAGKNRKLKILSNAKRTATLRAEQLERELKASKHAEWVLSIEIEKLKDSKSWRIVAPVRSVTALATGSYKRARQKHDVDDQVRAIKNSKMFDAGWYLEQYPDVAAEPIMPIEHYIVCGASEGRDPSANFSTQWYLSQNPDVAESGMNPLVHYILHGKQEGRQTKSELNESRAIKV
ncbi:coiled-coil domain-containing protein [Marinimicrobium alkaliphilum]|uniref:hypothetical protein n=1 Tax=Marinimicrobium alkaliphilum TaxID=2202654 RepID=UPI000DBA0932|nr:hypothetical protein [Marinimicrobium alkaliphilum]